MRRRRQPEPAPEDYPPELAVFRLEDWLPGVSPLWVEEELRPGLARVHWERARRLWRRRSA